MKWFAGKPDAPHNCTATNRSHSWIHVSCSWGFDGGLPQEFIAEVKKEGRLVSNMSSHVAPEFPVRGLEPGVLYTIIIYSSNDKGRSADTAILAISTLGQSSHQHQRTNKGMLLWFFLLVEIFIMSICYQINLLIIKANNIQVELYFLQLLGIFKPCCFNWEQTL